MRASHTPRSPTERRAAGDAVVTPLPARGGDDAALVARAIAGDRWAGEALYRRHAQDVIRVATLLLGRTAEVDDVVQDAFVKALRSLATLRDPASFGAWVARIAANLARSRLRRRGLLKRLGLDRGDEEVSFDQLASDGVGPEERAELARISKLLREMPADARIAWTLRRVEGWPLQEIAEAVGASLATVKRRIVAADEEIQARIGASIARGDEA
ncbi:RNA polymerase sigma factor [Sandaracinus amylolyticus]|uniref:RNA polymerase sigma-54 factor RpoN n=1 Tax=Sandaracinus amylolyticus TaxID=927083 RepID=A0A0F6W9J9_9BACT|nr:RNA polymerase sigma factor [Sandaracinus amylolyticus]AKF10925.1 RNA polymerase sigma-54 factor RpoN [Sandaracinus amylolyticus]